MHRGWRFVTLSGLKRRSYIDTVDPHVKNSERKEHRETCGGKSSPSLGLLLGEPRVSAPSHVPDGIGDGQPSAIFTCWRA